jgi:glutathione S-transferase
MHASDVYHFGRPARISAPGRKKYPGSPNLPTPLASSGMAIETEPPGSNTIRADNTGCKRRNRHHPDHPGRRNPATNAMETTVTETAKITLFHSPNSRSTGTRLLLEELQAPYDLHVLNMQAGEQRLPEFLAVNPMGKVPAILHGDALVTEQVAIYIYLADLFPQAGLAPGLSDPNRGPYLRWLAFYGACFEPAAVDRAMKRDPAPPAMSPYGDFDTVMSMLTAQLEAGPYILGQTFSAADVLWGTALRWTTMFGLVPASPTIAGYIERIATRPAAVRVREADAALAAQHRTS